MHDLRGAQTGAPEAVRCSTCHILPFMQGYDDNVECRIPEPIGVPVSSNEYDFYDKGGKTREVAPPSGALLVREGEAVVTKQQWPCLFLRRLPPHTHFAAPVLILNGFFKRTLALHLCSTCATLFGCCTASSITLIALFRRSALIDIHSSAHLAIGLGALVSPPPHSLRQSIQASQMSLLALQPV
jgi:hypothetical protein